MESRRAAFVSVGVGGKGQCTQRAPQGNVMKGLFIEDYTVEGTETGRRNTCELQQGAIAIPSLSGEEKSIYQCCSIGERLIDRSYGHDQRMKPLTAKASPVCTELGEGA